MHSPDKSFSPLLRLFCAAVLGCALTALPVQGADEALTATVQALTPEQQAALIALDKVVANYEALAVRDPDAQHKAAAMALLAGFKQRSEAVHKTYDQGRYDELRVDLNLEYQRLASWMAAPKLAPATAPAAMVAEIDVYKLNPAPANKAAVKAALDALDWEIRHLEARVEAVPAGAAREAAKQQFKVSKEQRAELGKDFTKARWDALIRDLKAQSEKLPH